MPEFAYTARTMTGENVAGTISAATKRETLCALSDQNLFPLHVECTEAERPKWQVKTRIKTQLIATNLSQLADLLQNGVPMMGALEILTEQAVHPALAKVLTDISAQVAEGMPLDEAFARHPNVFSELTISMVRAGSEGAFLEDALKRIADFLELQEELKSRIVGAMTYPAFLAVAGSVVVTVLIVFFVPKFETLFKRLEQQGTGLPGPTIALLALSHFLGAYGIFVIGGLGGLAVWIRKWGKSTGGRLFLDRWKLKVLVIGPIFLNAAVSRFCRVLGTLLENGVPLLKSLDISSDSTGNRVLADAIQEAGENISAGETLAKPLADCGLIPRPVMAMISVAEKSNNLDNVLVNIADTLDRQNERQLDMMVRMIEPMMLLIMGGIILFVLVALLLPVFDMSATMA